MNKPTGMPDDVWQMIQGSLNTTSAIPTQVQNNIPKSTDSTDWAQLMSDHLTNNPNPDHGYIAGLVANRDAKIKANPEKYKDAMSSVDFLKSLGYTAPDSVPTFTPPAVEDYKSPYSEQQQQALDDYNKWASQPYVSQYAPQIESLIKNILSRQFNYDPANDAQFQLASKELTRNVMESMNARGILNSTVTENQTQQGIANLLPTYKQQAYNQFQDEGKTLMSQVDMLMGLDNTAYGRYQDQGAKFAKGLELITNLDQNQYQQWHNAYTDRYTQAKDKYAAEIDKITMKQNEVTAAWKKVDELGYVDNKSAITLGVDPGTLSKDAREAKTLREQQLADQKAEWEHQDKVNQQTFENNKKLDDYRAKNDLSNSKAMAEINTNNAIKVDNNQSKNALANGKTLDDYRTANDIKINAAKASSDKETQKLITFNDLQTQFSNLKKQLTTPVKSTDKYGRTITTPGMKADSVEYLTTIGSNLIALVENQIITPQQANQLSVTYTKKSYKEVSQLTNYTDTLAGYSEMLSSNNGLGSKAKMRAQIQKELESFTPSDIELIGKENYKKLLEKFKLNGNVNK